MGCRVSLHAEGRLRHGTEAEERRLEDDGPEEGEEEVTDDLRRTVK